MQISAPAAEAGRRQLAETKATHSERPPSAAQEIIETMEEATRGKLWRISPQLTFRERKQEVRGRIVFACVCVPLCHSLGVLLNKN